MAKARESLEARRRELEEAGGLLPLMAQNVINATATGYKAIKGGYEALFPGLAKSSKGKIPDTVPFILPPPPPGYQPLFNDFVTTEDVPNIQDMSREEFEELLEGKTEKEKLQLFKQYNEGFQEQQKTPVEKIAEFNKKQQDPDMIEQMAELYKKNTREEIKPYSAAIDAGLPPEYKWQSMGKVTFKEGEELMPGMEKYPLIGSAAKAGKLWAIKEDMADLLRVQAGEKEISPAERKNMEERIKQFIAKERYIEGRGGYTFGAKVGLGGHESLKFMAEILIAGGIPAAGKAGVATAVKEGLKRSLVRSATVHLGRVAESTIIRMTTAEFLERDY